MALIAAPSASPSPCRRPPATAPWRRWTQRLVVALLLLLAAGTASWAQAPTRLAPTENTNGMALPVVIERGAVTVRAEDGLEALAEHAAAIAWPRLQAIREDLAGLPVPAHVELRLIKNAPEMTSAAPTGATAPAWAAGVAYPQAQVVVVATRRNQDPIDVDSVIAHELAHLALGTALGAAPRWLHEGFAYLHSAEAFSLARTQTLTGMVWFGNVIPLDSLERSFPAQESAVDRAYAEAYDFVAFLARRGRYPDKADDGDRWTFRRFLADVATDGDVHRAARANYGASLDELFGEWHQDLRDRYIMMPAGMFAILIWVFGALLLILGYLRRRGQNRARLRQWSIDEDGPPAPPPLVPLRSQFDGDGPAAGSSGTGTLGRGEVVVEFSREADQADEDLAAAPPGTTLH